MTVKNAIQKLKNKGYAVTETQKNTYYAEKENKRDYIKFLSQDGHLIIIDLRRKGQEDDPMTDYHAGTFCDNLSQALRLATV